MFEDVRAAKHKLETATISAGNYMKATQPVDQAVFLQRTQQLFDRLGNPERGLKTIHIAGTSGKGSTSMMLYEILRAAGQSVGIYTSPYLQSPIENVAVNGELMDPAAFVRLVDSTLQVVDEIVKESPDMKPSYSEIFFSIAVQYLKECGVEYFVLETGCGGRFDYSNIDMDVIVSVITPIGIDHTDILGDTIEKIAWHKAGIIKQGIPVFNANTNPAVNAVIAQEAAEKSADVFLLTQETADTSQYHPSMRGTHQLHNARLAAAVCRFLGQSITITDTMIQSGITAARLPARMEILQQDPLVILDGAHSEPKLRAMQVALLELTDKQPIIILSLKETKELDATLAIVLEVSQTIICTSWALPGFSSYAPEIVAEELKSQAPHAELFIEANTAAAIEKGLALATQTGHPLLITGSLYLAGNIREHWIKTDDILTQRTMFPSTAAQSHI